MSCSASFTSSVVLASSSAFSRLEGERYRGMWEDADVKDMKSERERKGYSGRG